MYRYSVLWIYLALVTKSAAEIIHYHNQENSDMTEKKSEVVRGSAVVQLREWASNSACHGIPNIERSAHLFRRLCWIAIALVGTGLTVRSIVTIVQSYLAYEVKIGVNITHSTEVTFPTVTICNMNPVRNSAASAHLELSCLFDSIAGRPLKTDPGERQATWETFQNIYAAIGGPQRRMLGHDPKYMLMSCIYQGVSCNMSDFIEVDNTRYGNCIQFNSQGTKTSSITGSQFGLQVELFLEQPEYVPDITEGAGMVVGLTSTGQYAFPQFNGIQVKPHTSTGIAIKMEKITRLEAPYSSDCVEIERSSEESARLNVYSELYDAIYDLQGCTNTCYQKELIKQCGCADPAYPMNSTFLNEGLVNATQLTMPCVGPTDVPCEEGVEKSYLAGDLNCNCNVPCRETNYVYSYSESTWPNDMYLDALLGERARENEKLNAVITGGISSPEDNVALLSVFFQELNFQGITESPAYDTSVLLANLGGIVGFFLGLSIVALFEFLELFVDLLRICWTNIGLRPSAKVVSHNDIKSKHNVNHLAPMTPVADPEKSRF